MYSSEDAGGTISNFGTGLVSRFNAICGASPQRPNGTVSERFRPAFLSGRRGTFCGLAERRKKTLVRACEQPVDCALVLRTRPPSETIVSTIKTLYLELLAWLNTVHLPEFRRQDNLTLGRDGSPHNK